MKNLEFIVSLFFLGAFLLNYLAKRQKIKKQTPQQGPGTNSVNADSMERISASTQSESNPNEWGSGDIYSDVIKTQALEQKIRRSPIRKSTLSNDRIQISTAAKVAKRISPFTQHFRTKRATQLAIISQVVLGPCRATTPYEEHQ